MTERLMSGRQLTKSRSRRFACLALLGAISALATGVDGQLPFQPESPRDGPRGLHFKLPLAQPEFHWRFTDPDAFLGGRLTLRILRDGASESIVVFDDGVISPGWVTTGSEDRAGIYFGFQSESQYLTSVRDSLEIELIAVDDLAGIGAQMSGVLRSGTYRATGSYLLLTDRASERWLPLVATLEGISVEQLETMPEAQALVARLRETSQAMDPQAFIQCWSNTWTLEPTGDGWLSAEDAATAEESRREREAQLLRIQTFTEELAVTGALPVGPGVGVDGRQCH